MSIETLVKKYEEELPKRWTREGERVRYVGQFVTVGKFDEFNGPIKTEWQIKPLCEVCDSTM